MLSRGFCVAAALIVLGAFDPALAQSKRVMVLHSFGREFKPWSDYARTIRTELERQAPWPLDITDHSLVTARSSDDNPDAPFVEYLRALFARRPLDLIVSIGAPAASFIQRHRQQLFANTPMVFTAVDERRVQTSLLSEYDTVVAVRINYRTAIENILQVLPDTKNIMVVVGSSPIEKFWRDEIEREVQPLADRLAFSWTDKLSFEDILKQAAVLPPHWAIFWELMIVDAAGVVHEGSSPLARLHAVAKAPIFSYDESFFGREIVGGPLLTVHDTSQQTAAVAIRILGGEPPGNIKTPPIRFATPRFDWREMRRWGISEDRLPPGSEIFFRNPTVWEQYRIQILVILGALLLQGALIAWLLYEHHRRHAAEIMVRNTMNELAHSNRVATAGQLTASIAHEIRQPLAAIAVAGQAALNWLNRQQPNIKEVNTALRNVIEQSHRADGVIENLRAMFKHEQTLREPLDVNELVERVEELVSQSLIAKKIVLQAELAETQRCMVLGNAVQLQQVLLNLINNAIEALEASAHWARILHLRTKIQTDSVVLIEVEDSGPGLDPNIANRLFMPFVSTKPGGMGMGLSICKSIVEAHGGQLTARPAKPRGTVFVVALPLFRGGTSA